MLRIKLLQNKMSKTFLQNPTRVFLFIFMSYLFIICSPGFRCSSWRSREEVQPTPRSRFVTLKSRLLDPGSVTELIQSHTWLICVGIKPNS